MTEKTCNKCGETKPVSEFALHNRNTTYLRPYCKKCGTKQSSTWQRNPKHKQRVLTFARRYREKMRGEEITPLIKITRLAPGEGGCELVRAKRVAYGNWHCIDCGVPVQRPGKCGNCGYATGREQALYARDHAPTY